MPKWRLLQYLLVVILVAVAVARLSTTVRDVSELSPFRHVLNYWWLAAALLLQMLQYASDGFFTRRLLQLLKFDVSLIDTIRISALDVFGATLLPLGQFGSMAAAFYFYRQRGLPSPAIVFLNVAIAAITVIVLTVLFVAALATLSTRPVALPWSRDALAALAVLLAALSLTAAALFRLSTLRGRIGRRLGRQDWYRRLHEALAACWGYARTMTSNRVQFAGSVAAKDLAYYAIDIASIEGCFLALHTAPHVALVATAYLVSLVFGYIAMTPAGLGATDATLTVVLLGGGVSASAILGMILLYRLINVVLPAPLGAWCFYTLRREGAAQSA